MFRVVSSLSTETPPSRHPPRHGKSKAGTRWTPWLVEYGLDRFHRLHLRTPTQNEIRIGVPDLPSYKTIQRMYGTVGEMLRVHGYAVRPRGGAHGRRPVQFHRDACGRFLPRVKDE